MGTEAWPELTFEDWVDTRETFHLWTQVVGKVQLELRPFENQWWEVGLSLTSRGLATGMIPAGDRSFQICFDLVEHELRIECSDGGLGRVALEPRTVKDFYGAVTQALANLGVQVQINPIPSELPDPISLSEDTVHSAYDGSAVRRWWQAMLAVERVIQRYRTGFSGKSSPVLFYWGGLDLNHSRFSGRPVPQPADAGPIRGYGENEENFAVGFWPGSREAPGAALYAYMSPAPDGVAELRVEPAEAQFVAAVGEFMLPYDALRALPDPDAAALRFFESTYEACAEHAGWDRAALEGPVPPGR